MCPDFEKIHKKPIYNNASEKSIGLSDLSSLLQHFFPEISPENYVCNNCYRRFVGKLRVRSDVPIEAEIIGEEELGNNEIRIIHSASNLEKKINHCFCLSHQCCVR